MAPVKCWSAFRLCRLAQSLGRTFGLQYFKQQLKGARKLQRQMQWGRMRVVEHKRQQNFLWVNNEGKQYEMSTGNGWTWTAGGWNSSGSLYLGHSKGPMGKTYDLRNAYKQYGIDSGDRSVLRTAVWNPAAPKVQLLGLNALPFGAIGSVSSFLRISMAIWYQVFGLVVRMRVGGAPTTRCLRKLMFSSSFFPSDASWLSPGRSTRSIACCRDEWIS